MAFGPEQQPGLWLTKKDDLPSKEQEKQASYDFAQ
jgi:hypothetical protein